MVSSGDVAFGGDGKSMCGVVGSEKEVLRAAILFHQRLWRILPTQIVAYRLAPFLSLSLSSFMYMCV